MYLLVAPPTHQSDVVLVTFYQPQRAICQPTVCLSVRGSRKGVWKGGSKLVEESLPGSDHRVERRDNALGQVRSLMDGRERGGTRKARGVFGSLQRLTWGLACHDHLAVYQDTRRYRLEEGVIGAPDRDEGRRVGRVLVPNLNRVHVAAFAEATASHGSQPRPTVPMMVGQVSSMWSSPGHTGKSMNMQTP